MSNVVTYRQLTGQEVLVYQTLHYVFVLFFCILLLFVAFLFMMAVLNCNRILRDAEREHRRLLDRDGIYEQKLLYLIISISFCAFGLWAAYAAVDAFVFIHSAPSIYLQHYLAGNCGR